MLMPTRSAPERTMPGIKVLITRAGTQLTASARAWYRPRRQS